MPGLLNRGASAAGTPPMPEGQGGGAPSASPEEQAQYDQFVANGIQLMTEGQGEQARLRPALLEKLGASDDWVQNLGNATATIVLQLLQSAAKAGTQLSGDVLLHGGKELLELMVEAAERAGLHEYSEEEMEGAFYVAADLVREQATAAGLIDPEPLKSEWSQITQAEQQGRLDEVLPGIEKAAARSGSSPQQGAMPADDADDDEEED